MKIEILDEAGQDLLDGFKFYESQSEGLGAYFLDSVTAGWKPTPPHTHRILIFRIGLSEPEA